MSDVVFPDGLRLERLEHRHSRRHFDCGERSLNDWLATKALQNQEKHLSVTKVLVDSSDNISGYYTLAMGQVDFGDLPREAARKLPRRALPVAILAWLGVASTYQTQGLGSLLLARALRDCHDAGQTFAFVAIIVDCINDAAKRFYKQWDFEELPGNTKRLFLSAKLLGEMMAVD